MDIGELVIRIQATADNVSSTFQQVQAQVQAFGRSIDSTIGKGLQIKINTDSVKNATADTKELSASAQDVTQKLTVSSESIT